MSSEDIDGNRKPADPSPQQFASSSGTNHSSSIVDELTGNGGTFDPESRIRRTAGGLTALGVAFALAGVLFPPLRNLLITLAAMGLFGGVLVYYLSPNRPVSATVADSLYTTAATNETALADALGFEEDPIYVPIDDGSVRLVVPGRSADRPPRTLSVPCFTADDCEDLVLEPTGENLVAAIEGVLPGDLPTEPDQLAVILADGLVEGHDLARAAEPTVDLDENRATIAISDPSFSPVDRFDHPIRSVFGVGFAAGLDRSVTVDVTSGTDDRESVVTCQWET